MSLSIDWLVDQIVIQISGTGEVKSEDIHDLMEQAAILVNESDAILVHTILDLRHATPSQMSVKSRIDSVKPLLSHPRCGWIILVREANPITNFISSTAAQVFKARFRNFDTMQGALEFLANIAPNLPDDFVITNYI